MTSWADLRAWTEEPFVRAYGEAKHLQEIVQQCGDDVRSTRLGVESVGEVAERLRLILAGFEAETDVVESALTLAMRALNEAEESVEQIRMEVEASEGRAGSCYLEISDYGVVSITQAAENAKDEYYDEHPGGVYETGGVKYLPNNHPYMLAQEYLPHLQTTVDRILEDAKAARSALAQGIAEAQVCLMFENTIDEAVGSSAAPISEFDVSGWSAMTPAAVRANWDALSEQQQQQVLRDHPELIGNLAGIPFAIRQLANDKNMQAYIDKVNRDHPDLEGEIEKYKEEITKPRHAREQQYGYRMPTPKERQHLEELEYLLESKRAAEALLSGDGAVKFDPEGDSVIAVNGDLTADPDKVVTYAPGTDTTMSSFAGGVTDLPGDVVSRLEKGGASAAAFTVKDGPWSTWRGEGANSDPNEMKERGEKVAEFQGLVQLEDYKNAETVSIGHSAGMTKISAAEMAGMLTDESISIGGSYLYDEWRAAPGTEYSHIQYKNDAINLLDPIGKVTPHNQPVFEKTYVEPNVNNDGFAGHVRIAEGVNSNELGVEAIADEIED